MNGIIVFFHNENKLIMNTKEKQEKRKQKKMIHYYRNEDIKISHYQGKYNKQDDIDNINNEFNVEEVSEFSFKDEEEKPKNKEILDDKTILKIPFKIEADDKLTLAINSIVI